MAEWLHLEIPAKLVGETIESGSEYIKTYRTEILLPKDSQYLGYCFTHPSKLVSCGRSVAKLTYNDTFSFNLIKKDREPGKRYKRYTLTADELIDVYAPEVEKLKARLAKKRLAQNGTVEILECRGYHKYYWAVVFSYKKDRFWGTGSKFIFTDEIHKSRVIAEGVTRSVFESAHKELTTICEDFHIILDLRHTLNQGVSAKSSNKTVAIYDSFYSLSERWEAELCEKAASIIERARTGG